MRCPYCGKVVRDVPDHLNQTTGCSKKYAINLLDQFKVFMNKEVKSRAKGGTEKTLSPSTAGKAGRKAEKGGQSVGRKIKRH